MISTRKANVRILLYNPDNGVTRNFMPHLWMFLLKTLTPPGHEVVLIDGNAKAMNEEELIHFVREQDIALVGIGAMTRMIAKAYRMADAIRGIGVPVVMGGPHVTELPNEALGMDGGPRHADAVAVGEADTIWPGIVRDAANGQLKDVYQSVDTNGKVHRPSLQSYAKIPWETIDLEQFNLVPVVLRRILERLGKGWRSFHMIPVETGRGCPYGCEFCTVTGYFGNSIRFRTNESVVDELLRLKARGAQTGCQFAVFFVDDNLSIKTTRLKSLLRDIIAAGAQLPWVGQISANLLRDEELLDLIADSGGKWVFIGMESIDQANLKIANKNFIKPGDYGEILDMLAKRNIYAITSFIFGMDHDTPGVAKRTLEQIDRWAPGLPVFGQLTPYPSTPLYDRLAPSGRLVRPKHWLEFAPFEMAHIPEKITPAEVREELDIAWSSSYSPGRNTAAIESISDHPVADRIIHLVSRLFFRGIYFTQMSKWAWVKVVGSNWRMIFKLTKEGLGELSAARRNRKALPERLN
jgi:radical SAM superfamily enzyme YgiQ (UPF0313 family)